MVIKPEHISCKIEKLQVKPNRTNSRGMEFFDPYIYDQKGHPVLYLESIGSECIYDREAFKRQVVDRFNGYDELVDLAMRAERTDE